MTPFAWPQVIGFGLGVLRLPPAAFWAMTPRELSCAISAVCAPAGAPIDRATLHDLMQAFPDRAAVPAHAQD